MYEENLRRITAHGFIVVFPFIKVSTMKQSHTCGACALTVLRNKLTNQDAEKDTHWWVTNTDGSVLMKSLDYAAAANVNETHPLFGKIDLSNIVLAGHSMGAHPIRITYNH